MEKRKDSLSALKICRFCLTQDVPLGSLYDRKRTPKNAVNLPLKILSCVSVEVFPSDRMPSYICSRCTFFMNICYEFKQICRQADETILQYVQNNTSLDPVLWPSLLNKTYRGSKEIGMMKTVVEGGATVEVTHDSDSEDDEDENVYNIKINDGSEGGRKACIKVVASRDNQDDEASKQESKGLEEGCWPCDECDCTYPLQQMLELHKVQKHRARTVQCGQCDDKFYNKYDLAVHLMRHSQDTPFKCVACGKKFKRQILLKRHEKVAHADLPQQICSHCPATFLSHDELKLHLEKHVRSTSRSHFCTLCDKTFNEKGSLQRHIVLIHHRVPEFACEYCPERFATMTKLSRHVRSHAGDRPYPCKYCEKSFLKSHHYTRHLRLKHREAAQGAGVVAAAGAGPSPRGPFAPSDQYRCEQCDYAFANQDDLIYHSAIHATRNLTCPLCQEKFPNVDAVTAHIKSHVNGVEFMCDFCELVFTTKEKLEKHLIVAHEDEIQNDLQDESSLEIEAENDDDDDDNSINMKEEDDHMIIEIKKPNEFMLQKTQPQLEDKHDENTNSEDAGNTESESETAYTDMATVEPIHSARPATPQTSDAKSPETPDAPVVKPLIKSASILRKAEEVKRRSIQNLPEISIEKKEKPVVVQVAKTDSANDKSLRLLEKELQDLKRTNSRVEVKAPAKPVDAPKPRGRPPLHTSTPKLKATEEKKPQPASKPPIVEKKQVEKKLITKENKEPKEIKTNAKEDKDVNKTIVKNGTNDKSTSEDGVRRSTRPSKIKDYAKMIRVRSQGDDSDSDELEDDEEYREHDRSADIRGRGRRSSVKPPAKSSPAPTPPPTPAATPNPRKRGRPRKEPPKDTTAKVKKVESEAELTQEVQEPSISTKPADNAQESTNMTTPTSAFAPIPAVEITPTPVTGENVENDPKNVESENNRTNSTETKIQDMPPANKTPKEDMPASSDLIVSPTGQTLKKVPMKSLPPGVKPLPLPLASRNMAPGELCEMQIGKKVVKVQKIVMTKAEVEAMAKKGLVEMKDGTMVLKQGIKIPTVDSASIKALTGDIEKESPTKKEKAAPTRCDIDV